MPGYHPGNSYTIITAPIDKRPISKEYLKYLVSMGGDSFYCVDDAYLDLGPDPNNQGNFKFGDPAGVQNNLKSLISTRNYSSSIVIINTTSYVCGGLVGSRIPNGYDGVTSALAALDTLTTTYSNPRYYVHIPMPRTIPDPRFSWLPNTKDSGLTYFYTNDIQYKGVTPFVDLLREWSYLKDKQAERDPNNPTVPKYPLESYERDFMSYFEDNYINSLTAPKYNGLTYPALFERIYRDASDLAKKLIDRVKNGTIDELIIGADDVTLPNFYLNHPQIAVSDPLNNNSPIKFSLTRMYLNNVKAYHAQLYGDSRKSSGEIGNDVAINYLSGTDEVPQSIYARDLTRRTGFATNFIIDFSLEKDYDPVDGSTVSKTYVAPYDYLSAEKTINQRLNFVLKRGYLAASARKFRLFVHNWAGSGPLGVNNFSSVNDNPERRAVEAAITVYNSFNNGENVGVLDLGTNMVDWELFQTLGIITGHQRTQLACYSGWNTAGNAVGLGIAHGQIFGILDYYDATKGMWSWHANLLAQHLLEDAIYNTKIKSTYPTYYVNTYMDSTQYYNTALNTWQKLRSDSILANDPGGYAYVMRYLTDSQFPMRLAGNNYTWVNAYVKPTTTPTDYEFHTVTGHPWNRAFECILDTYIW